MNMDNTSAPLKLTLSKLSLYLNWFKDGAIDVNVHWGTRIILAGVGLEQT